MPTFELKLDSGVMRSWLVKLVRADLATSTILDHFLGAGEVARLVVEARRHAPRALVEARGDHRSHPFNLFRRRSAIDVADHRLPDRVEADVAAEVHGQSRRRHARSSAAATIERSAAIGVEDLRRHALRQHVDGGAAAHRATRDCEC